MLECVQSLLLTTLQVLAHTELRQINTPLLAEGPIVLLLHRQTVTQAIVFDMSNVTPLKCRTQFNIYDVSCLHVLRQEG